MLQPAHGKITLASGLRRATSSPCSGSLSLRLRDSDPLASPRNATRRFILQKTRRKRSRARDILPVHGFRFCFTPLAGVLFAFPSRYFCTIGSGSVFSLGSWSTRIRTGFLVPRPTQVPHHGAQSISLTGLSPSSAVLSGTFCYLLTFSLHGSSPCGPTTPELSGLGSSAFARRYLRNLS